MLFVEQLYGKHHDKAHQNDDVGKDVGKDVSIFYTESIKGAMTRREAILDLIRNNPSISASEIAIILKVSARTIERDFDWLKDRGIIVREGSGKVLGLMADGLLWKNQMMDYLSE